MAKRKGNFSPLVQKVSESEMEDISRYLKTRIYVRKDPLNIGHKELHVRITLEGEEDIGVQVAPLIADKILRHFRDDGKPCSD